MGFKTGEVEGSAWGPDPSRFINLLGIVPCHVLRIGISNIFTLEHTEKTLSHDISSVFHHCTQSSVQLDGDRNILSLNPQRYRCVVDHDI